MAETPREWEESAKELRNLLQSDKWPKSSPRNGDQPSANLNAVSKLDLEERFSRQAICSQQEDEICGRKVEVDVLEAQESGEDKATPEQVALASRKDQ